MDVVWQCPHWFHMWKSRAYKDGERDEIEVLKGVGVQILALHYWLGRAVRCGFRADTFVCRKS